MSMSVGGAASSFNAPMQVQSETSEKTRSTGGDTKNDGDKDDTGGVVAVKPTTNFQGQVLGQLINAKA